MDCQLDQTSAQFASPPVEAVWQRESPLEQAAPFFSEELWFVLGSESLVVMLKLSPLCRPRSAPQRQIGLASMSRSPALETPLVSQAPEPVSTLLL